MFWRSPPRPMSLSSGPSSPCSRVSTVSRSVPCSSYPGVSSHSLHIQLNLFCSGSPLEDEVNLAALENLTVDLTVPLLGGKVHGSLARAGKVRGQTPKVSWSFKRNILFVMFCPSNLQWWYTHAPLRLKWGEIYHLLSDENACGGFYSCNFIHFSNSLIVVQCSSLNETLFVQVEAGEKKKKKTGRAKRR